MGCSPPPPQGPSPWAAPAQSRDPQLPPRLTHTYSFQKLEIPGPLSHLLPLRHLLSQTPSLGGTASSICEKPPPTRPRANATSSRKPTLTTPMEARLPSDTGGLSAVSALSPFCEHWLVTLVGGGSHMHPPRPGTVLRWSLACCGGCRVNEDMDRDKQWSSALAGL